ncbi:MAG: hypothetical protein Q3982_09610 [Phoenicibacter congonensis]|uniref:DUF8052 domain-containing protein n=1 Tax=Phoenicibacter congonensis TaxID=1944646 RepID=A0AA43RJF0_9ACTN|nr:hypothetical protein [Phoenicibacter congonensis]
MDDKTKLIKMLLKSLAGSFDVVEDYEYCGQVFPGYGEFHESGSKYVLSKKAELWKVEADEHMFFQTFENLDVDALNDELEFMKEKGFEKVNARPDHMSTAITIVCVCDNADDEAKKAAKHAKHRKNYKLSFWGWADLRVVVVDLANKDVVTNAFAKHLAKFVKPNLELL